MTATKNDECSEEETCEEDQADYQNTSTNTEAKDDGSVA